MTPHDAPWTWRIFAPAIRGSPAYGSPRCSGFAAVEWMDLWSSGVRMDPGSFDHPVAADLRVPTTQVFSPGLLFGPPRDPSPS